MEYSLVALSLLESDVVQLFSLRGSVIFQYVINERIVENFHLSEVSPPFDPFLYVKLIFFYQSAPPYDQLEKYLFCRVQHSHRLRGFVLP